MWKIDHHYYRWPKFENPTWISRTEEKIVCAIDNHKKIKCWPLFKELNHNDKEIYENFITNIPVVIGPKEIGIANYRHSFSPLACVSSKSKLTCWDSKGVFSYEFKNPRHLRLQPTRFGNTACLIDDNGIYCVQRDAKMLIWGKDEY